MRNNTDFKMLLGTLDSSRLIFIRHLLTAQYTSDCQEIVHDTEHLNILVLLVLVKK
jgi:hypothetical protein